MLAHTTIDLSKQHNPQIVATSLVIFFVLCLPAGFRHIFCLMEEDLYEPGLEPRSDDSDESEGEFVDVETLNKAAIDPDALEPVGAPDGEGGEQKEEPPMIEMLDDSVQGFFDHSDAVFAVAINPVNPALVISGGCDDRGFLFSSDNGERVSELGGHSDSVAAVVGRKNKRCFVFGVLFMQ